MADGFYLGLVLLVALLSLAFGFRRGITKQLASLLGVAFGAVTARVLTPDWWASFHWVDPFAPDPMFADYAANLVCASTVYFVVFWLFCLLSKILNGALSVFETGIFNRILGAVFMLIKNLLWVSMFLNFLICFKPDSGLLRYERASDGNLVSAVMELCPAFLGCYGAEDFAHFHQLKEAKSISCAKIRNFNDNINVILTNRKEITLLS